MNQNEILEEIKKCKESPYYFATNYLTVKNHAGKIVPFTTPVVEKMFNEMVNNSLKCNNESITD
jgi:hypothetical protein